MLFCPIGKSVFSFSTCKQGCVQYPKPSGKFRGAIWGYDSRISRPPVNRHSVSVRKVCRYLPTGAPTVTFSNNTPGANQAQDRRRRLSTSRRRTPSNYAVIRGRPSRAPSPRRRPVAACRQPPPPLQPPPSTTTGHRPPPLSTTALDYTSAARPRRPRIVASKR